MIYVHVHKVSHNEQFELVISTLKLYCEKKKKDQLFG